MATQSSSSFTQLNSLSGDPTITQSNNSFVMPSNGNILFGYYQGATASRGRIQTQSLQARFLPNIYPVSTGLSQIFECNIADYTRAPIPVVTNDFLEVDIINGGSEASYAAVAVSFDNTPAVLSNTLILRGTSTTTLSANVYTTLSITWDQNLPSGLYSISGASVVSSTGVLFRLILTGQEYRPGGITTQQISYRPHPLFRYPGLLPEWGRFTNVQMPRCEVLATAADSGTQNIFLHCTKVG
jgi:hypothetical protein